MAEKESRSARISWSPSYSGNSPVTSQLVQHKVTSDAWDKSQAVTNTTVAGDETSVTLSNLVPVHSYSVRVYAVNALGRSEASDVLVFWSEEEGPAGPPLHVKALATSSHSMRVSWHAPPRHQLHGRLLGYYVGYKELDAASFVYKTLDLKSSSSSSEGEECSCEVTGLKRGTRYAVSVSAFNGKGTGPGSEALTVQTLDHDPPLPPLLSVSAVDQSSMHLTWDVRQASDAEPPVSGFVLFVRKQASSNSEATDWEQVQLPGDSRSHTLQRLGCGCKYEVYMQAFNSMGKSAGSERLSVATTGTAAVAPDSASLISTNVSAAILSLDAWHDGSCPISHFVLALKAKKAGNKKPDVSKVFPDGQQKRHVLHNLLPGTVYQLSMTAVNEAGRTEGQYTFTTTSLMRHVPSGTTLNDQASVASASPPLDPALILPATVSLLFVTLLIVGVKICLLRKDAARHRSHSPTYCHSVMDSGRKGDVGAGESLCMSDMDHSLTPTNCSSNKQSRVCRAACADDGSAYCPSPYATTTPKNNACGSPAHHVYQHHAAQAQAGHTEPMYATVKRIAARAIAVPRSTADSILMQQQQQSMNACHVYQYPVKMVTTTGESCLDTDSCLRRVNDEEVDEEEKRMTSVPLLISEDGRQISVGTIRANFHRFDHNLGVR